MELNYFGQQLIVILEQQKDMAGIIRELILQVLKVLKFMHW